ncbi:MAG: hypothetical protein IPP94_15885, partial [Ignavibacteria bacterium]|nr:hypothetical protein [Ignavibacteria bacterium]
MLQKSGDGNVQMDFYRGLPCDLTQNYYGSWNTGTPGNRVKFWKLATDNILHVQVDASKSYCMQMDMGGLGVLNYLQITLANRATGTTVNFMNVTLSSAALGNFVGAGWLDWHVDGLDFSAAFVIEGDLVLGYTPPLNGGQETNKLALTVGSIPVPGIGSTSYPTSGQCPIKLNKVNPVKTVAFTYLGGLTNQLYGYSMVFKYKKG